jgi:hypothetical protein
MKNNRKIDGFQPFLLLISFSLVVLLSPACNVVVPNFEPATEFGFPLSGELDLEEPYATGILQCKTELYPNQIFPTENAAFSASYLATLNSTFPGWTFNNAAGTLSDDAIEIKTYDAIGTSTMAGVWIHARYVPHGADPITNIHWVQILTTNHGLRGSGHGSSATYVDVASGTTTPYYDEGYAADGTDLIDRPFRSDASRNHTWEATTFLVTGPNVGAGPGTVTLLGPGFTWGWKNTCSATDGLQEYYYYQEELEVVRIPEIPRPGRRFQLISENPEKLILGKEKSKAYVPVLAREISFTLDKKADVWGVVSLLNGRGKIKLGAYEFEGKKVPAATAEISGGVGFMHLETGEVSMEYMVTLQLPNGEKEKMVFAGTGQYDKESRKMTMNSDMVGISAAFLKSNIPKDSKKNKGKK